MAELMLFSQTKCCDFSGKLPEDEQIYCIGGTRNDIFLGTNQGRMIRFRLEGDKYRIVDSRQFPSKKTITSMELVTALNQLFVICGFEFHTVSLEDFKIVPTLHDVMRFAVNVNPTTEDPFAVPIAFALKRSGMIATELTNRGMKKKILFETGAGFRYIAYSRNTICYASEHHYMTVNTVTKQFVQLFKHDCPTPTIVPVGPDEFLVRSSSGLSIFVNSDGTSSRPPCVLTTNKGPLFFKEPHIINCDRTKIAIQDSHNQHLEEFTFEKINAVNFIEGQLVLVNNKTELHVIRETPAEDTIAALIERHQYAQAIDLLEKSLNGKNDGKLIQKISECSEKGAIVEIKANNFDAAANYLVKYNMNVAEILEQLRYQHEELGENLYPFVKHLLMKIRTDKNFNSQHQLIDYELMRICYQLHCQTELDYIANFLPEPLGAAEIFVKHNEIRRAAELLFDSHKYEEAIPLFIRVGVVLGASHLRPLMFKINRLPYTPELIPFFSLLAPFFPEEISELLFLRKCSLNDAHFILRGLSSWETFLERQPLNDTTTIELAISYITAVENEDEKKRRKLRSTLLSVEEGTVEKIKVFLDTEKFQLESAICAAKTDPTSVLEKLLAAEDFESAELLSAKFSKSHPEVALRLLKEYLNNKNRATGANRIGSLLAHVGSNFNAEELLTKLPSDITISELLSFLKSSVIHTNEEKSVRLLQLAALEKRAENPEIAKDNNNLFVQLNDNSQCPVCKGQLTYGEPLMILPTRYIVHSKCYRNPNLCPVTNVLFK